METKIISNLVKTISILLIFMSCSEDEGSVAVIPSESDTDFNFIIDAENPNIIHFTANPTVETWFTHWSFGDGSSAEGTEASKTYFEKGSYDVRFKIFTEGGIANSVKTITIDADLVDESNLVQNGGFSDGQDWTVLPISPGIDVAFEDGNATWSGSGGHVGIYQAIEVEANITYQVDMNISGSGATDSWFEVYAGASEPVPNNDYSDGGMLLGLNTWSGCGNSEFTGTFTSLSCNGGDGTFQYPTDGTVYLVIRGGGADYGAEGISIDNISVRAE